MASLLPSGSTTFTDLSDGGSYGGTATATLAVSATTTAMSGDQFRLASNVGGAYAFSNGVTLTVNAAPPPPPPPSSGGGGGGGGGSVDALLLAGLLSGLLAALQRRMVRARTRRGGTRGPGRI